MATAKYLMDGVIGWNVEFRGLYDFFDDNAEADDYWLTINSPGGSVDEGKRIYDLIKAQTKPVTIEIYSAHSIASAIVLAAPTRLIHPNGEMLIHLPWTDPGPINENDLAELQAGFAKAKDQILDIYASGTSADRAALTEIMEAEKMLTASEAIVLGFATGYARTEEEEMARHTEPVFALNKNDLQRGINMNALEKISGKIDALLNKKDEVQGLTIALDSGKMLEVKTGSEDVVLEGMPALIDSQDAEDGDYTAQENGYIYRVEGGKIASIEKPEMVEAKKVGELIVENTKKLKDHFEALLKDTNEKLEAAAVLIEKLQADHKAANEEIQALKEQTVSSYTPPRKSDDKPAEKSLYGHYYDIVKNRHNGAK